MPFDLMELVERFPQLSFEIDNPNAPSTIYISDNFSDNRLTLVVTTNQTAALTPGKGVPISEAPNGVGSLLYLNLTPLGLTDKEFNQLTFTVANWAVTPYPANHSVCFTPLQNVSLAAGPGNSINIEIGSFAMSSPPSGGSVELSVTYFRVGGITVGNLGVPSTFKEILQNPPGGKSDLHQAVSLTLDRNSIVNNLPNFSMVNSFTLNFSPGDNPVKVEAGDDTVFILTFVYAADANGYGALTTPNAALGITVERGLNADEWTIIAGTDQLNPSWMLRPKAKTPIVGTGAQAVVAFNIGNIITSFQPGPTMMFVSYKNVQGYQNGSYSILLEKYPHVNLGPLSVSPNPACFENGVAPVTVSWEADYATQLILGPLEINVTDKQSYPTTITQNTIFTLQASGLPSSQDNIATAHCAATISGDPCSGIYLRMPTRDDDIIGGGPFRSPDIIPFGVLKPPASSIFSGAFNMSAANPLVINRPNSIYVRGKNFTNGPQTSRVYLYYAPNEVTTVPKNWLSDGFTVNSVAQNWLDLTAHTKGELVASSLPILWTPTNVSPTTTYSLLAWVVDKANPQPPDLSIFQTLNSNTALETFFQQYLNVAVNNNIQFYTGQGPISTMNMPITSNFDDMELQVGAVFSNFPVNASVSVHVAGWNTDTTVNFPRAPLGNSSIALGGYVVYPPGFTPIVTVSVYQEATPIDEKATVTVLTAVPDGLHPRLTESAKNVNFPNGIQFMVPVTWPKTPASGYVGLQVSAFPTDGFVSVKVPGPDPANSFTIEKHPIVSGNMSLQVPVTWPPNYNSILTISWEGATPPPVGAGIDAIMTFPW